MTASVAPSHARSEREWLTRKEAAAYLTRTGYAMAAQTLANMASKNRRGPKFVRFGWTRTFYRREDLDAWREQQIRQFPA